MVIREYTKYEQDFVLPKKLNRRFKEEVLNNKLQAEKSEVLNTIFLSNSSGSSEDGRCNIKDFFNDTLLIIGLGSSYEYEGIPLYELLYKGGFRHRIICGPGSLSNDSDIKIDVVNTRNGAFLYECLTHAVSNYPEYEGYFFAAEEILVNYWKFELYDKRRIWQDADVIAGPTLYTGTPDDWEWWASPWGMRAVEKAFEYLVERNYADQRRSKLTEGTWEPEWDINNALNGWLWNGRGDYKAYWVNKTVLYLPKQYVKVYKKLAKIFRQSGVRHAIAMPTIMQMLDLESETIRLRGELVDAFNANTSVLQDRDSLTKASNQAEFLYVNGGRKERRVILNDLKLKEFAMGKFLYYDECPG
eukprot:gene11255-12435_t